MAKSWYQDNSKTSLSRRARQSQRAQMHRQTSSLMAKNWRRTPYYEDIPEGEEHLPIPVATTPTISIRGGGSDPPTTRNSVDVVKASATWTRREVAFEDNETNGSTGNEDLPVSKVSKVSFVVGHEKGEELG